MASTFTHTGTIFDRAAGEIPVEVDYVANGPDSAPEIAIVSPARVPGTTRSFWLSDEQRERLEREIAGLHRLPPEGGQA